MQATRKAKGFPIGVQAKILCEHIRWLPLTKYDKITLYLEMLCLIALWRNGMCDWNLVKDGDTVFFTSQFFHPFISLRKWVRWSCWYSFRIYSGHFLSQISPVLNVLACFQMLRWGWLSGCCNTPLTHQQIPLPACWRWCQTEPWNSPEL